MEEVQYWQISEFASLLGFTPATIYNWFNNLEEKGIHYTNRDPKGQKIFSNMDYKIAEFIKIARDKKISLEAIYEVIPGQLDVRAFPEEDNSNTNNQVGLPKNVEKEIIAIMRSVFKEELAAANLSSEIKKLETPKDKMNDLVQMKKIESKLKISALKEWSQKSEQERFIKVGLFRREEDLTKREIFVEEYLQKHYEDAVSAYKEED